MIDLALSALGIFGKLGSKLIEDKDKKTEFAFKTLDIGQKFMETMLATKTYPWIDALVKLSYAGEQIVKGLFRPVGTALMTAFAIYAETNGIELSATAETILYGAFPAWGLDRAVGKHREAKIKKKQVDLDEDW